MHAHSSKIDVILQNVLKSTVKLDDQHAWKNTLNVAGQRLAPAHQTRLLGQDDDSRLSAM